MQTCEQGDQRTLLAAAVEKEQEERKVTIAANIIFWEGRDNQDESFNVTEQKFPISSLEGVATCLNMSENHPSNNLEYLSNQSIQHQSTESLGSVSIEDADINLEVLSHGTCRKPDSPTASHVLSIGQAATEGFAFVNQVSSSQLEIIPPSPPFSHSVAQNARKYDGRISRVEQEILLRWWLSQVSKV